MNLSGLIPLIAEMPAYSQLVRKLGGRGGEHRVAVIDAAKPYLVAALHKELRLQMLWIVPSTEAAKKLYEHLLVWCDSETRIMWFPEPDALPYEHLASDPSTEQQRLQVLSCLNESRYGFSTAIPLIITSAAAAARKTIPHSEFDAACHILKQGIRVNPIELLAKWDSMGYRRESLVQVPGTMSQRGGILDIYPPNSELPARVEFLGNEVDSIRLFDPQSQRSLKPVESLAVVPALEAAWPATDAITDYLPPNSLLILDEPGDIEASIGELDVQANELRQSQFEKGELPEDSPLPYFTYQELKARLDSVKQRLILTRWSTEDDTFHHLAFAPAPGYGGQLKHFFRDVEELLQGGHRVIVVSHQAARLGELLQEENIFASPLSNIDHPSSSGSLALVQGSISDGWAMGESTVLFTDAEIFGFVKQRRLIRKRPVHHEGFLPELSPGDYAVHIDHGIARFAGMTKMQIDDVEREYLTLEYAAGDRLHVPIDQADRVSRYIGSRGEP
ncbi:MAG TPA: CarD family transcriptional regulator, partial [Dehalococcoidia bacterium]|nr:CarD family transcriptional regulator [Dehalococcoidia bacterium]